MAIGTVASAQVASGKPVAGHGFAGNLKVAYGTYNIASAVAQNDVIQMCRTPKGAVILDVAIFGQDIDTGPATAGIGQARQPKSHDGFACGRSALVEAVVERAAYFHRD